MIRTRVKDGNGRLGGVMIANDQELSVTLERVARFQTQVTHLRHVETDPASYHTSVSGFLAEIDRMQLEVREYLVVPPADLALASSEGRRD
jgi:hypothetical protein